jgi:hypothetical protein
MLGRKRVERVSSVMIVIMQGKLPQFVALDLGYTAAGAMYQATTVIHSFTGVDFSSTDSTSLVAHVIFVMIVIIKCFWSENRARYPYGTPCKHETAQSAKWPRKVRKQSSRLDTAARVSIVGLDTSIFFKAVDHRRPRALTDNICNS